MARMKTFITYFLCLVGFIFLSYLLENGLIGNMYVKLAGDATSFSNGDIVVDDIDAKASNVNGYMSFKLTDNSQDGKDKYLKIDLFNKKGNLVATKYLKVNNLDENNQKDYQVKIRGQQIRGYKISVLDEDEIPDLSNIITVFGYDIDLSNVFGLNLSNLSLFGTKVKDLFGNTINRESIKSGAANLWVRISATLAAIPWWGYAIAGGIIIWYMPARYLFGIFP